MGTNVVTLRPPNGPPSPPAPRGSALAARTDDELMLLAAAGDLCGASAFEALVRRHSGRVLGFCTKHAGDAGLGEEMAQEVWLSVWSHRADYQPGGKFVVWLFTLAKNRARNRARDRARAGRGEGALVDEARVEAQALDPGELDRVIARERAARAVRALGAVPEPLREAVLLRFSENLAYDEIARVAGTNESTARSRVFHGLRELRKRLLKGEP